MTNEMATAHLNMTYRGPWVHVFQHILGLGGFNIISHESFFKQIFMSSWIYVLNFILANINWSTFGIDNRRFDGGSLFNKDIFGAINHSMRVINSH